VNTSPIAGMGWVEGRNGRQGKAAVLILLF